MYLLGVSRDYQKIYPYSCTQVWAIFRVVRHNLIIIIIAHPRDQTSAFLYLVCAIVRQLDMLGQRFLRRSSLELGWDTHTHTFLHRREFALCTLLHSWNAAYLHVVSIHAKSSTTTVESPLWHWVGVHCNTFSCGAMHCIVLALILVPTAFESQTCLLPNSMLHEQRSHEWNLLAMFVDWFTATCYSSVLDFISLGFATTDEKHRQIIVQAKREQFPSSEGANLLSEQTRQS